MKYLSNSTQIRLADKIQIEEKGILGILLMENAGRLSAEWILQNTPDYQHFVILIGAGNNGGDGLVIARYLHLAGKKVHLYYAVSPQKFKNDALLAYQMIQKLPISTIYHDENSLAEIDKLCNSQTCLIDALLGTGITTEPLKSPFDEIIAHFSTKNLPTIAIDLPSGLSADTGFIANQVISATVTLTFQLPKICHYVTPASEMCGKVEVLDIGIWQEIIENLEIQRVLITHQFIDNHTYNRNSVSHKGDYGHLLVIGGCENTPGAVAMTAHAAVKNGVGLCTAFVPRVVRPYFYQFPEIMVTSPHEETAHLGRQDETFLRQLIAKKDAIVIGTGLGKNENTYGFLKQLFQILRQYFPQIPVLLDADALNLLAEYPDLYEWLPQTTIITPHEGEMSRLINRNNVANLRLETAENYASLKKIITILKGKYTIVACPSGQTFINTTGNPGMATGGSGDVLAGIIGAELAKGKNANISAAKGVFLHGLAGDKYAKKHGQNSLSAIDIIRYLQ